MMFTPQMIYFQDPDATTHGWRNSHLAGDARHYFKARENYKLKLDHYRTSVQLANMRRMVSDMAQFNTLEEAMSFLAIEISVGENIVKECHDVIEKREDPKTLPSDEIHYRRSA